MVIETARPITEIARDIHVNEGTLGNWVNKYRAEHVDDEPALSVSERARLRELEREVRELRMKPGVLGKSGGLLRPGASVSSKYEFIDAEKALYPVVKMCEWMVVSTSGFYEWRGRPSSATNSRRAELSLLIGKVFADSDDTSGYRRVPAEHDRRRRRRDGPRPAVPRLHRRPAGGEAGRGHHLHPHLAGLDIFGHRYRLLHQGLHRLRDGRAHASRPGHRRAGDGEPQLPPRRRGDIPLRPGHPIHLAGVRQQDRGTRDPPLGRAHRGML